MEPAAESLDLVRALRRGGYGVHLGTNQESYRAAHMREVLGYDGLFDVSCYSCELGAAKPDLAFFTEAAGASGRSPRRSSSSTTPAGTSPRPARPGSALSSGPSTTGTRPCAACSPATGSRRASRASGLADIQSTLE